jgi:hypothetical protein
MEKEQTWKKISTKNTTMEKMGKNKKLVSGSRYTLKPF